MGALEELAAFITGVRADQVPSEVHSLAQAQFRSVLASLRASKEDPACKRIEDSLRLEEKIFGADSYSLRLLRAALIRSVALDFDDYMCFAHGGHSSVLVPLVVGQALGKSQEEIRLAQIIGNEVAARLGGSCLVGPLNGQMWSFVHAASAAAACARILELSEDQTKHALSLSLWQVERPTMPGFMGPDSKLLIASDPALRGLKAAFMAACDVKGPLDLLEAPDGFYSVFAFAPIKALFESIGQSWALRTLSIKPYPGCAYLDTIIDCLLAAGPIKAEEIAEVSIYTNALAMGMDALSRQRLSDASTLERKAPVPSPVLINFSIPYTAALVILAGRLTEQELLPDYLHANSLKIQALMKKIRIYHEPAYTAATLRAFSTILPPSAVRRVLSMRAVAQLTFSLSQSSAVTRPRPADALALVRQAAKKGLLRKEKSSRPLFEDRELAGFEMVMPSRIVIKLNDGNLREAEAYVPLGAKGSSELPPQRAAQDKWERYCKDVPSNDVNVENLLY